MTPETERQTGDVTRRRALKTGAILTGVLASGGTAIGTVGASTRAEAGIVGEHHFVRAAGAEEPSAKPDPQDRLVERRLGHPVDDGRDEEDLDGTHQLR